MAATLLRRTDILLPAMRQDGGRKLVLREVELWTNGTDAGSSVGTKA